MEAIAATMIAAVAILGLAHSFGLGRGQIDRFTVARAALAAAEDRMETLSVQPASSPDMSLGAHDTTFVFEGESRGVVHWEVSHYPLSWSSHLDHLTQVDVDVQWDSGPGDAIHLTRYFDR